MESLASCQGQATPSRAPGTAQDPARLRIAAAITPGKPGAPTERIEVARDGELAWITVTRTAGGEAPLASAYRNIDPKEIEPLWETVRRNELQTFEPKRSRRRSYDFGLRQVHLAWTLDGRRGSHEISWDESLDNESRIKPLFRQLARLAQRRAPEVRLSYFRP
jgi:hypothetical protein